MKKILLFIFFLINVNIYSQVVNGQFLIGGAQEESTSSTIQLTNGDYLFCGTTKSYGNGGQDLLLIRFNPDFSIQWQKTIGGSLNDFFNNMTQSVENSDGSIMLLGNTKSYGMGNVDMLLIKISALGNVIWSKVYGGNEEDRATAIRSTIDGGFIFCGSTDSYNTITSTVTERDLFLVKIDALGNVIWSRTWGTTDNDDASSSNISTQIGDIVILQDSSFLISGILEGIGSFKANNFIARINSNGTINWFKKYTSSSSSGHEVINTIVLQNNTNAFASGLTKYGSIGSSGRGLLFNFNINTGNVIWAKNYGNVSSTYNWIFKNHKESSNKFVLSMYENGSGFGDYDISCFAIDSNGLILQQKVFGTPNFDLSVFSTPTIDNGYLFSGVSGTGTNANSYLIKTNNLWETGCNESNITISSANITITPQTYSPTIVTTINTSQVVLSSIPVNVNIDTLCIEPTINCNLTPNFSSTLTCFGDSTYFTDLSIDSIGNIIDWDWNFGDGTILSGTQNPSHFYTSAGSHNVTLIVTNDNNCTDSITIPITIYSTTTSTQNQSICQGDSALFGGQFYTTTGIYIDSLQNSTGCDSIATLNLTVISSLQTLLTQSICQGDSILLGGSFQYSAGVFTDSLQALAGCDSIVITTLTVNQIYYTNQNLSICAGDSILIDGAYQNSSGIYTDSLQTTSGCDSIITINLTVNPIFNINQNAAICQGDSILLGGAYQHSSGIYTDVYSSSLGCDSSIITTLSIKPSATKTLTPISICDNDSVLIFGTYQNQAGVYNQIITNGAINGCDSIVYQELLINPTSQIYRNATICSGDSIFLGGAFQTVAGNYVDVFSSSLGCDSIVTTNLNVVNNFLITINDTICQGDSILIAGNYQTNAGIYSELLVSSAGCDSLVTINLTVDSLIHLLVSDDAYSSPCESVELLVSGGSSYYWSPSSGLSCTNCANPIASPFETTLYTVIDISNNCSRNNTVTVFVQGENEIFVPNVFTPNRDGQNDGFNIKASCIKSIHKIIYNRWGMVVFESTQLNEVWDGKTTSGVDVPDGTYFYIFDVTFDTINGTETNKIFKGAVTLLR